MSTLDRDAHVPAAAAPPRANAPPQGSDAMMRAVVQDGYGSADVLRLAQVARPGIAGNDVLLRVHAAGLDRGTWHLMTGKPYAVRLVIGLRRPRKPVAGRDVAGTVAAVGPAVTGDAEHRQYLSAGPGSGGDAPPRRRKVRGKVSITI